MGDNKEKVDTEKPPPTAKSNEPVAPKANEMPSKKTKEPSSPVAKEPSFPNTKEPSSPILKEPSSPKNKEPSSLNTKEPSSLNTKEPSSPILKEPSSPKTKEPSSPVSPSSGKAVSFPNSPSTENAKPKPKMTATERIRTESTGSNSSRRGRLQREISRESKGGLSRQFSRQDSTRSRTRRPSLSIGHADSIPFHLEKPVEIDKAEVPWWTSKRLLLSLTCFVGFFFLYSLRVNLSTAIVCMVREEFKTPKNTTVLRNETRYEIINGTNTSTIVLVTDIVEDEPTDDCPMAASGTKLEGEFEWDKKLRGFILGAFFWGYTVWQIPSGYLSDRFGPRYMVSLGMFPVAILTIISPFLAKASPYLLLVGRVLIGFGEAMMYPGMQALWAKWSPPHERSRLVGFAFGGSQLGNALTFPIAGLLCAYGFDGGWPSVFYITGAGGFMWCCFFFFFARDSPGQMPGITDIEKKYIEASLGVSGQTVEQRLAQRKKEKPWKAIFTSGPVWAILLANGCGNYGAYMLLTQMPTYMKEVLKFDIKSNGAFSMIPYLVFWIFIILGGQFADFLISRSILSIEWTRKLCCTLGTVIPAIFLILTGYMDCHNTVGAVVLLSLSMGFCGFQFSSFFINHGDIAPKYAGTVFGFTNTGASIPGIIAPYIVGALTPDKSREQWLLAFYIAAAVYVAGAVIYAILAKGEIQPWAVEELDDDGEEMADIEPLKGITEAHDEDDEEKENEKAKMMDGNKNGIQAH